MEEKILQAIDEERLLDTAVALIEIPSPTLSAGAALPAGGGMDRRTVAS